jgi:hypothetical protein
VPAAIPAAQPAPPPPGDGVQRKPRRRRRRRRPEGGAPSAPSSDATPGAPSESGAAPAQTEPQQSRQGRGPRHRQRHHRGARDERPREGQNRSEPTHEARVGGDRGAPNRDFRGKRDKRHGDGRKDRPQQRHRDDRRDKLAPKLYRLESVVDRGFEDVPDPATEGSTRRVDWTILKRTTADQRAARAVSAIYVLRRDGAETEFAQLSAARAAVNKTITHPEKLTLSKADHFAAKGGAKK